MAFKVLFLAHTPDAEPEKHQCVVETSKAVGENVGVSVARGDGPSNKITKEVMKREGWFSLK